MKLLIFIAVDRDLDLALPSPCTRGQQIRGKLVITPSRTLCAFSHVLLKPI